MTNIVGLTGLKGSGKDTAAKVLKAAGFEEVKMAEGLKRMIRAFLYYQGVESLDVERMIEGDLKEIPCEFLGGKSPREFMQLLGTEFGRKLINDDLWVDAWKRRTATLENVVTTDIRFPNEAQALAEAGGELYRIERDTDVNTFSLHESEKYIPTLPVKAVIDNQGTIDELNQEMILRFLGPIDHAELMAAMEAITIRYQITIDMPSHPHQFDTYHETGKNPSPAKMLEDELHLARSVDSTPWADYVMSGEFEIEGRVL